LTGPELRVLADRLRGLHGGPAPLLLPNAWDVSSALAVERAGAAAVATTSSGVAAALGYPDGEAIPVEEMLDAVRRIAGAVDVPVTADIEAGFGLPPAELVGRLLEAGAVGLNLEDTLRDGGAPRLGPMEPQAERIAETRAAADAAGVPLVVNARIDVFLRGEGSPDERVEDGLRRAAAYVEAGADCVYPIWLVDRAGIERFVREAGAPVNVLLRPGAPTVAELTELGVRRISVGGGLARHADAHVEELARRLLAGDDAPFRDLGEA
jgi:2-methylisocitrate lyase-like PEP mutase family enzyme